MNEDDDGLPLSAFLNMPLVVFGHHEDAVNDYELFRYNAQLINSLGDVQWSGLSDLLSANYMTYFARDQLHVKPYAVACRVRLPRGTSHLIVDPTSLPVPADQLKMQIGDNLVHMSGSEPDLSVSIPVSGRKEIDLRVVLPSDLAERTPPPRPKVWPFVRRLIVEARDRIAPLAKKRGAGSRERRAKSIEQTVESVDQACY